MTTAPDVLALTTAALATPFPGVAPPLYPTAAADRVVSPGDIPTQADQYPILKVRLVSESKQSLGRAGPPEFTTTCTVRVTAEVSAPAEIGNVYASQVEAQLWAIKRQIEVAVINSYPLFMVIQQLASVQSQFAYTSEAATHLAGMQIDLTFEFYEGPEAFAPIAAVDLKVVHLDAPNFVNRPGFTADLTP